MPEVDSRSTRDTVMSMADKKHHAEAPPASARVLELGYGPMDAIHAEFEVLLRKGQCEGEIDWLALLSAVHDHLREHFSQEDQWMVATEFPPRDCHIDEHAAVLKSSAEVLEHARRGDFSHGRSFIDALANWFPGHADYLDSALAAWMCKSRYGGKPVVLHRAR